MRRRLALILSRPVLHPQFILDEEAGDDPNDPDSDWRNAITLGFGAWQEASGPFAIVRTFSASAGSEDVPLTSLVTLERERFLEDTGKLDPEPSIFEPASSFASVGTRSMPIMWLDTDTALRAGRFDLDLEDDLVVVVSVISRGVASDNLHFEISDQDHMKELERSTLEVDRDLVVGKAARRYIDPETYEK